MIRIETKRLIIKALSKQELLSYTLDDDSLEKSLGLSRRTRVVSERLKTIITTKQLPQLTGDPKYDFYYTFWTAIDKERRVMVADACFKGKPNANGEVEIGYAAYPEFQGKGFMTETVADLVKWVFQQENITAVLADTDPGNIASHRVLEKNGFMVERRTEADIYWRLEKQFNVLKT